MNTYIYNKKDIVIGLILKFIAIISAIYGLCAGIQVSKDLTYFTNLSNILILLALLIFFIFDVIILASDNTVNPKRQYMFITKYALTLCISITWLIYMCILAPTNDDGFLMSYTHQHYGSLCLHFITPVLAIIDFIFFDYNYKSTKKHSIYAIIPPLAYVVFIIVLASNGMRWDDMTAPYNFLNYGAETGWFGFDLSQLSSSTLGIGVFYMILVLVLIFVGIGLLFLFLNSLKRKALEKKAKPE